MRRASKPVRAAESAIGRFYARESRPDAPDRRSKLTTVPVRPEHAIVPAQCIHGLATLGEMAPDRECLRDQDLFMVRSTEPRRHGALIGPRWAGVEPRPRGRNELKAKQRRDDPEGGGSNEFFAHIARG